MPNIMLTYLCNLKCPYCFANEFVNRESNRISIENFAKAINFLTKGGPTRVGLIGGEPTLHPELKAILEMLIGNRHITEATLYTNGLLVDRYINQLVTPKFRLLVNCNSPKDIGEQNFEKLWDNLDMLVNHYYMRDRINLGVNLYNDKFDYSYIVDLLKMCGLHRVRISLTVPDFGVCGNIDAIDFFKDRKKYLLKFLSDMRDNDILPYYDCNKPPYCIWDDNERNYLNDIVHHFNVESNLIGDHSYCYPVLDILPDLRVVRCFGMSDFEKVKLEDFSDISEIASYFLNSVDAASYLIPSFSECVSCKKRQLRKCTTGCIGFKSNSISTLTEYAKKMLG